MADLAAYYAQLGVKKGDAPPATPAKPPSERVLALITRDKANACTTCHGANFNTPNDGTVPSWPASTPTTCSSRSSRTRSRTTRSSAAPTA